MSKKIDWTQNGGGDWFTGANWSAGHVPGGHDHVTLSGAAPGTIDFDGTDSIASLLSTTDMLAIAGGTLAIAGDANLAGGLNQSGGEISLGGTSSQFSGAVSISGGGILLGAGDDLAFTGSAVFGGNGGATIAGPGTFTTAGTLTIIQDDGANEAVFGDGLVWNNTGTVVDAGIFMAGITPGIAFTILNQAKAVFDFTTDTACLMDGESAAGRSSSDFVNAGLMEKTGGTGDTTYYATITSTGTILVETGTLDIENGGIIGGTITGPGVLEMAGGGTLTLSGLTASGTITDDAAVDQTGIVTLGGAAACVLDISGTYDIVDTAGIARAGAGGSIDVAGGALLKTGAGAASIAAAVTDDGDIQIEAGTLKLTHSLAGAGNVTIASGASFEAGAAASGITVTLDLDSVLILDKPKNFAGKIAGFVASTTLDLRGLILTGASASSTGVLTLEDQGVAVGTLQLTNNDSGVAFITHADHHGGTLLEIAMPTAARAHGAMLVSHGTDGGKLG